MKQIIYLGEWEARSSADNPSAFRNLEKLYDSFEVPSSERIQDINYLECIMWKRNGESYPQMIIVRKIEVED